MADIFRCKPTVRSLLAAINSLIGSEQGIARITLIKSLFLLYNTP